MNLSAIAKSGTKALNRTGLKIKAKSPQMLLVLGTIGFVGTVITACKATKKLDDILDEAKATDDKIHEYAEKRQEDLPEGVEYTDEDVKKDLTINRVQTILKIGKNYALPIVLGIGSLGCFFGGHYILNKRNVALSAAYASVKGAFNDYRKNVIERFGGEVDKELKHGVKAEQIQVTELLKNGKEKTHTETLKTANPSEYSFFFDSASSQWEDDPEANLMFLKATQNAFNSRLATVGHVYLNEVLDALDIPRTRAGQIVGWIYDPENPNIDSFIDFGVFQPDSVAGRRFVNGYEPVVLLDFNCQGNVLDLLYPEKKATA